MPELWKICSNIKGKEMRELIEQLRNVELIIFKEWFRPRTVFAMMFYSTLCYLIINQLPVPEILQQVVSFLMGFFFGQSMPKQAKEQKDEDVEKNSNSVFR